MKTVLNRHDKVLERFKKETILKWMASLTVTVVVTATIIVSNSIEQPLVKFNTVNAVGTTIVYDAEIIDPGLTIYQDSLTLEIKSSLESFALPLQLGQNFGTQEMRYLASEYTLSIKGSQGYGAKTFASQVVTNNLALSGAIMSYQITSQSGSESIDYQVDCLIYNKDNELSSLWLRYGFIETSWYESGGELPQNFVTLSLINTTSKQSVNAVGIPDYNFTVFMYLEGLNSRQETIVLDQKIFKTPPYISGSFYVQDAGADFLDLYYYFASPKLINQTAMIELFEADKLIATQPVEVEETHEEPYPQEQNSTIRFEKLKANTIYKLKMTTSYLDITGERIIKEIYQEQVMTTPPYSVSADLIVNGQEMTINLSITAPSGLFGQVGYSYYEQTSDYPMFLGAGTFEIISSTGETTIYQAVFTRPTVTNFTIKATADKTVGQNVYYGTILYTFNV